MKSGKSSKGFLRSAAICASRSSTKLWGRMREERPTAMPSVPSISSSGSREGRATGSLPRPS